MSLKHDLHLQQVAAAELLQLQQLCGICGDEASGLHYGIYSCEGYGSFVYRMTHLSSNAPEHEETERSAGLR